MRLNNLQLINFRNYDNLHLNFKRNINLLVGKNGQGKTNIVEAIYMLSFGKSFRTNKDKEIIKFGSENLYIGGNYLKNSSKGLMAKISYSNDYINTGVAGIVSELGSIPIKEYGDSINAFLYFRNGKNGRFTIGIEGFWFRHGIRANNQYSPSSSNSNAHHYNSGYYTDFSIQTFAAKKPFYAMSGFIFFEVRRLWKFDITAHFGIHDNNIYSNSEDIYQLKYRAFLKITFNITDDFKIMLSDTFTYDPVYKNNCQYYELEARRQVGVISYNDKGGKHYTVDNDFYLGMSFKFGGIWGK